MRFQHSHTASAAERVYLALKQGILEGTLAPGERLREQHLAARYQLSRTPVREALKKLEADGLINGHPGRGLIVADLTTEDIVEIYTLREILEGTAARLAAERATETDLLRLEFLMRSIESAVGEGDADRVVRLNVNYHHTLWSVAANSRLYRILTDLDASVRRLQPTTLLQAGAPEKSAAEHRSVLAAIRRRDGVQAERLAREHMQRIRNARIAMSVERRQWAAGEVE